MPFPLILHGMFIGFDLSIGICYRKPLANYPFEDLYIVSLFAYSLRSFRLELACLLEGIKNPHLLPLASSEFRPLHVQLFRYTIVPRSVGQGWVTSDAVEDEVLFSTASK